MLISCRPDYDAIVFRSIFPSDGACQFAFRLVADNAEEAIG